MLLGLALMGYGAHYLTMNGNCSSTGYVSYGPVPKCSGGEALYILSVFFLGPALTLTGWVMARLWGVGWPATCVFLGAGMITIELEPTAASGAKAFGVVAGVCLFALALLSVFITVRKRLRRGAAPAGVGPGTFPAAPGSPIGGPAVMPAAAAFDSLPPFGGPPAAVFDLPPAEGGGSGSDPLDRIAKLAKLRDSGALTEEEFEREKAKLLAQM